ncbi:hypothetical protein AGABI1DRAFT_95775 [Agaricus bisporus var. burnettii JB137-S8]|uniref:Uncharacterized protein n=1 Tax=Agaricus bisporus var. burnettii (strain JB137-S8 / ATCC MYA-4627 / FGSC 10392) TaxID=597362 RepID=K5VIT1_AGABU|nr:uncharacterized protein AGABI1DRAFT_95775 [Agaricus bisporus var. burnettii JB137-S8]EKM74244.1 hypothetical protein AGABI1DRAFT_95775 [Agaricus bisporus var. burnettii JB137-S8]
MPSPFTLFEATPRCPLRDFWGSLIFVITIYDPNPKLLIGHLILRCPNPHRQQSSAKPLKPGRSKDRVKETNKEAARRKKRELEQEAEDARLEAEIKAHRASRALAEAEAAQATSEAKKCRVSSSKARPKTPEPSSEEEEEEVKPKCKGKAQAKVELSEPSSEEDEDDDKVDGTPEGDDYEAKGEVTPPSKKTIPRPKCVTTLEQILRLQTKDKSTWRAKNGLSNHDRGR